MLSYLSSSSIIVFFSPLPIRSNVLANDLAKSAYNEEGSEI